MRRWRRPLTATERREEAPRAPAQSCTQHTNQKNHAQKRKQYTNLAVTRAHTSIHPSASHTPTQPRRIDRSVEQESKSVSLPSIPSASAFSPRVPRKHYRRENMSSLLTEEQQRQLEAALEAKRAAGTLMEEADVSRERRERGRRGEGLPALPFSHAARVPNSPTLRLPECREARS